MKKILMLLITLVLILGLTACAPKAPVEDSTNPEVQEEKSMEKDDVMEKDESVYINNNKLSESQLQELKDTYGRDTAAGRYWYDTLSGLQGKWGEPSIGYIFPGHDFGELPREASGGNTGVLINGRELTESEVLYLEQLLQVQRQLGNYWLDAQGNMGFEGSPIPFANLYAVAQQSTSGSGQSTIWSSSVTGAGGGSAGGCSYVNLPGSTGVSAGFVSTGC